MVNVGRDPLVVVLAAKTQSAAATQQTMLHHLQLTWGTAHNPSNQFHIHLIVIVMMGYGNQQSLAWGYAKLAWARVRTHPGSTGFGTIAPPCSMISDHIRVCNNHIIYYYGIEWINPD